MKFVTGNPEQDFFEQNPELLAIKAFKELRDNEGKEKSSKIMWSTYMIEDINSKIFRMPRKDKIDEVKSTYFEEYDPEVYKAVSVVYARVCMEKEEYLYKIQVEKMDELTSYLEELEVRKDSDFNKYLKIMDKLAKIWDSLDKVKTKMIEKKNKGGLRGGAKRSRREK